MPTPFFVFSCNCIAFRQCVNEDSILFYSKAPQMSLPISQLRRSPLQPKEYHQHTGETELHLVLHIWFCSNDLAINSDRSKAIPSYSPPTQNRWSRLSPILWPLRSSISGPK